MTTIRRSLGGLFSMLLIVGLIACSTTSTQRADIDARAKAALENLYRQTPAARSLAENSAGVLVFPDVTQGGLIVGGQYGTGVLFKGGKPVGHYNIAGGSLGLQAGAQTFSQAYFFTTGLFQPSGGASWSAWLGPHVPGW